MLSQYQTNLPLSLSTHDDDDDSLRIGLNSHQDKDMLPIVEAQFCRMEQGLTSKSHIKYSSSDIPLVSLEIKPQSELDSIHSPYPTGTATEAKLDGIQHIHSDSDLHLPHRLDDASIPRPAWISAVIRRPTPDTSIGVTLKGSHQTTIASIENDGLLSSSSYVCVHDRIVSINNVSCRGKGASFCAKLLSECKDESIMLVVENPTGRPDWVATTIPTPGGHDRPYGISIKRRTRRGHCKFYISHMEHDSPLASSLLNVGDTILYINGSPCTLPNMLARDVGDLLHQAKDTVTIVTKTEQETGVVLAAYVSDDEEEGCEEVTLASTAEHSDTATLDSGAMDHEHDAAQDDNGDKGLHLWAQHLPCLFVVILILVLVMVSLMKHQ